MSLIRQDLVPTPYYFFQLHVMDSETTTNTSTTRLRNKLSTPCNGFGKVKVYVRSAGDVLSTPCNGFFSK